MIRVVVSGALGRMGNRVARAVQRAEDMELVAGVEARDKLSQDPGFPLVPEPPAADVLVDFTHASVSLATLQRAAEGDTALVIGTTGFSQEQIARIKALSSRVPVLLSPNMSLGVNLLMSLAREAARQLVGFDIEIWELHHKHKRDAPSGTARALFETLREARGGLTMTTSRQGARQADEVGVFGLRGGEVFGDHAVLFLGEGEVVELKHRALSRECFVQGTLAAIRFVPGAEPGLYSMEDVLRAGE